MFQPGDKVSLPSKIRTIKKVIKIHDSDWLEFEDGGAVWGEDFEPATHSITVNQLREVCESLRAIAYPQGRFWIKEVFEKTTGEKL